MVFNVTAGFEIFHGNSPLMLPVGGMQFLEAGDD
jgi:hypothetical protein